MIFFGIYCDTKLAEMDRGMGWGQIGNVAMRLNFYICRKTNFCLHSSLIVINIAFGVREGLHVAIFNYLNRMQLNPLAYSYLFGNHTVILCLYCTGKK